MLNWFKKKSKSKVNSHSLNKNEFVKDLIYFDEDKASSLLSQFEGGLTKELHDQQEVFAETNRTNKVDIKLFQREFGGMDSERLTQMQTKILHHDLLNRVESSLIERSILLDLNKVTLDENLDYTQIRTLLDDVYYIKAEGFCTINDFTRLKKIMSNFSWMVEFINKCNRYSIKNSDEYKELERQFKDLKKDLNKIKDRNLKARQKAALSKKEKDMEEILITLTNEVDTPEEWLMDGFSKWVDIFNPDQIHLRNRPFDSFRDFEIVCNLKRNHFVEEDIDHITFSYGQKPDVKFTVLGLIASKPDHNADKNEKRGFIEGKSNHERLRNFSNSFLDLFRSMDGIEAFSRFVTYPDISVYPIAVYREIENQ